MFEASDMSKISENWAFWLADRFPAKTAATEKFFSSTAEKSSNLRGFTGRKIRILDGDD